MATISELQTKVNNQGKGLHDKYQMVVDELAAKAVVVVVKDDVKNAYRTMQILLVTRIVFTQWHQVRDKSRWSY